MAVSLFETVSPLLVAFFFAESGNGNYRHRAGRFRFYRFVLSNDGTKSEGGFTPSVLRETGSGGGNGYNYSLVLDTETIFDPLDLFGKCWKH